MNTRWPMLLLVGLAACGSEEPAPSPRAEPSASRVPQPTQAPPLAERARRVAGDPEPPPLEARYFAGQPSEEGLRHAAEAGVVAVINLRDDDLSDLDYDRPALCQSLGLSYRQIPIDGASFDETDVDAFVAALDATDRPALVRCSSGNRVGALWALYLARRHQAGPDGRHGARPRRRAAQGADRRADRGAAGGRAVSAPRGAAWWDARYGEAASLWGQGPNRFVAEAFEGVSPWGNRRTLDVACGEGRNAVWLAEQGWDASGVDFSLVALERAEGMARERGVAVQWIVGDLLRWERGPYALIVVAYLQVSRDVLSGVLRAARGRPRARRGAVRDRSRPAQPRARVDGGPRIRPCSGSRASYATTSPRQASRSWVRGGRASGAGQGVALDLRARARR
ncbi:MAG: sulfur transferase domain-containing protein [Planctomycetota bacterium]